MKFLIYLLFIISIINYSYCNPCALRKYQDGFVCVCNSTYCDKTEANLLPVDKTSLVVVSSSKAGLRFDVNRFNIECENKTIINRQEKLEVEDKPDQNFFHTVEMFLGHILCRNDDHESNKVTIMVDPDIKYQKMIGFGGSYTGSVTNLIGNLPVSLKHFFYKSYYSHEEGLGLNMMRNPIGGSNFDLEPWAYNEYPLNDINLTNFTKLDDRDLLKICQLKELMYVTNNYDIKFMGVVFSPPRWMKTDYRWDGYNKVKPEYYQTYANYHLKYLELMQQQNITYWALSTGNELWSGLQEITKNSLMGCGWPSEKHINYISHNLGPAIRNSKFKDIKLLVGEDQRFIFPWYFLRMENEDKLAMDYIDGFSVHWYFNKIISYKGVDSTSNHFSDKFILNTEASSPRALHDRHPVLGSWSRAEEYIFAMIEDFSHSISGWLDNNLALDEKGGPTFEEFPKSDASIIVNTTSWNEFYKQPLFYATGHFSKFIIPDSIRIFVTSTNSRIKTIAFLRPDNIVALIIFNPTKHSVEVDLRFIRPEKIILNIPEQSVHTILYELN